MKTQLALSVLVLAACNGRAVSTPSTQGLAASSEAQRFGVASYVVDGPAVLVLDSEGGLIGSLRTSAPTEVTRLVTVDYADGREVEFEVDRPMKDGRFVVSASADQAGAILSDPALEPTFAAYQLRFTEPRPAAGGARPLGIDSVALCADIPFVAACTPTLCDYEQRWGSATDYFDWGSANGCTENGYLNGTCYWRSNDTYDCQCDRYWNDARRYADCTVSSACIPSHGSNGCDIVAKRRHCDHPGSCVNQAEGTVGCAYHNECENY